MSIDLQVLRHTASHVLAAAVMELFPNTKLAIGPATADGFYYDFDVEKPFTADDLAAIEKKMTEIKNKKLPLERFTLPRNDALALVADAPYKVELINDLPEDAELSFYKQGDFTDLCAGPHAPSTADIGTFKLLSTAGAYWRGSEKNQMLCRIYGTAFHSKAELHEYLEQLKEAAKRDHNKLGRELKYFTTNAAVGQGLPLIMPKGAKTIQILSRFVEDEEERRGYTLTRTPVMAKNDLYKISGHWDHYRDGMFILGDEEKNDEIVAFRPMTCPFQFMIYKTETRSYRDLPIRYNETASLFRNEASGEMHGLIRMRQFTLSDAHIMCTPEQVATEFKAVLELEQYFMKCLGIQNDIWYRFSKWDSKNTEKYINDPDAWTKTEAMMKVILDEIGLNYVEAEDEAAFYGPKLDIQFKNVFGKEDTLFTIQIDFALAERFDMTFVDHDNTKKRPYIIHRASIGCYERTLAMMIEKYAGALPLWMMSEQVRVMTITDENIEYAESVTAKLKAVGLRVALDSRSEKIGYKIREAREERIPYMLVIGEAEMNSGTVAARKRGVGDIGVIAVDEIVAQIKKEADEFEIF